jgi:uncharacterized damage-inducible protein DinB
MRQDIRFWCRTFQLSSVIPFLKHQTSKVMDTISLGAEYAKELETEAIATRKCLERVPENLWSWKPHQKSMDMGYLVALVAEIPKWISYSIEQTVIDLATFPHDKADTTAALVANYDRYIEGARKALQGISNEGLKEAFYLKHSGKTLFSCSQKENVSSTLNHWVHHRGQLTVYMRLNDIAVPSIYGPSADDKGGF